jgi:hypothetical protein
MLDKQVTEGRRAVITNDSLFIRNEEEEAEKI